MRKYWVILQAGLAVAVIRILVRLLPLPRVLSCLHADGTSNTLDRAALDDLAYYTDRWLILFPANAKGNCFPRSLTLYRFARRLGFPVRFHCGIQKNGQTLDGHAWLSLEGAAFLEPTRHWEGFTVTYSYPCTDNTAQGPTSAEHVGASSGRVVS
ncbi:hypothetical protein YTPLAS18_13000 [Nitrospira sp.]|nr:hypothetical protein YTPLAS18_13000 [Nitrospira sp.]